jgi:hypothetical protein
MISPSFTIFGFGFSDHFSPQRLSAAKRQLNIRIISRKARKDRQVKSSNFLGAWGWVAFAPLALLGAGIPFFLTATVSGNLRVSRKF